MNNELIKMIGDKEYHFKFSSKKIIDLEKATGKSIFDLLQDASTSNIARLLKACVVSPAGVDEYDLLDELMQGTESLQNVMIAIVYEAATLSGIISRADKNKIDNAITKAQEEEALEESKKK